MGDVTDLISIPITDGASLLATVKTNAQGVHTIGLECEPTKPMGLVLHWGVIRPSTGAEWQLLPPELNPPGTTVYKQKALQSPFPAFGALQLVLDPGVVAVEFCLTSSSTGEWFNDAGRNFRIELAPAGAAAAAAAPPPSPRASDGYAAPTYDLSRSPPPPPPSTPPPSAVTDASLDLSAGMDILYGVAAYLRWEELGKPRVDERQRSDIYAGAVNHITERQRRGESIESLEREFGLPPGLVRKTALEAGGGGAGAGAAPVPPSPPPMPAAARADPASANSIVTTPSRTPAYSAAPAVELSPADVARLCDQRAGGTPVLWRKELNMGDGTVKLMVVEARKASDGHLQFVCATRSDRDLVLHWATQSEPAGEWTAPPHGWRSEPANSWGTGGASWETEMEPVAGAPGWAACTITAPVGDDGIVFVLRTADNKEWIKDDGQDFMVFPDERRSNADVRALVKQRKEEKRRAEKEAKRRDRDRRKSSSGKSSSGRSGGAATFVAPAMPAKPSVITRKDWNDDDIRMSQGAIGSAGAAHGVASGMVDQICGAEEGATRSLMHRYNIGSDLLPGCRGAGEAGMVAMATWFRFMALRQLVWNNDYNIKPREISAAQLKCTSQLAEIHRDDASLRDVTRLTMATIGRGGEGDVGQRIRDEILAVQQANNCKGGMMEEWHQKLHNNTSPDDVPICEALLKFIASDCDISVYWDHLHANGIDAQRMASYDRKICSEPSFKPDQYEGLTRDLKEYLRTLKAVHSGADLDSASEAVLGYHQDACKGKEINVPPIEEVASPRMRELLHSARGFRDLNEPLHSLEAMLEARRELWNWTRPGGADNARLKDIIYLDLALESAVRQVVEGALGSMSTRAPADVLKITGLALENLALSTGGNDELVICLREWKGVVDQAARGGTDWALQAKAIADRVQNALGECSQRYISAMQDTAREMGGKLGVDSHVLDIFSEEIVRGTAAAPLSQMLRAMDPILREMAHMGAWQIISPVEASGVIEVVADLKDIQTKTYSVPTVLVSRRVGGEEDIPAGVVGVITPDMPDILSHVSVRARNEGCLFATVFDAGRLAEVEAMQGQAVTCVPSPAADDLRIEALAGGAASLGAAPGAAAKADAGVGAAAPLGGVAIKRREFAGRYAVASPEFTGEIVGSKSRNLQELRGRLPDWINLPAQVALPFCTFDAVLTHPDNEPIMSELIRLRDDLRGMDFSQTATFESTLARMRAVIQDMVPTDELTREMSTAFAAERLDWPEGRFGPASRGGSGAAAQAWAAITGVWASKYNERAVLSCRKAGLTHEDVSMAVLCQPVVQARYAFVLHTTNPQTSDPNEIYGEVVCGMGEALVGNFPGRAMSFVANKNDLTNPRVIGFPSKANGLFTDRPTLIFRSDSNGEDLEGFAGAGLYDSIQMHEATMRAVDYSTDPMVSDEQFRGQALAAIAHAANEIELALGSPQDIEGCIAADGALYVVQTRPQV
jgi:alpha-glucan,water dikinase